MAYLFVVEKNVVKPNPEVLLIHPFSEIWERDNSANKARAIKDFTYMEFLTSKKKTNPYEGYSEEVREKKLREEYYPEGWYDDNLIEIGLAKIRQFQEEASHTMNYYLDALHAAENTRKFLRNIDLNARNERTGNPLYKPKDVTSALADTEKIIQSLFVLKEKVDQELFETVKTKGGKTIGYFEQ